MSDGDDIDEQDDDGAGQPPSSTNDDAGSPAGLARKERRVAREKREAFEFWRSVFASEVGRREMFKILLEAHTFEERFACGPNGFPQSEATWFHAGEQALGQRIYLTWSKDHRADVLRMHDENDVRFGSNTKARS